MKVIGDHKRQQQHAHTLIELEYGQIKTTLYILFQRIDVYSLFILAQLLKLGICCGFGILVNIFTRNHYPHQKGSLRSQITYYMICSLNKQKRNDISVLQYVTLTFFGDLKGEP